MPMRFFTRSELETPGTIFYFQERVGERGADFNIIKFRSMRQDTEKDGAVWVRKDDDRITRFGGFIRKIRIDEMPQLWNVFKGEMSLVDPVLNDRCLSASSPEIYHIMLLQTS